jgi:Caspase domain
VALVVGNQAYQHLPRLATPDNDAQLIAATLKDLGFTLIGGKAQTDLDRAGFEHEIREFGAKLAGGSVGLFYYAGHGVQVRGANHPVPVGANPTSTADVDFELIDAELVLKQMEAAGSKLNFVILDACRNNPFGGRGLRDSGGGLAQMKAPTTGTMISYATQPGNAAADGTGNHSPYPAALADTLIPECAVCWSCANRLAMLGPPLSAETTATPKPVPPETAAVELTRMLQTELKRVGCYASVVDGTWGRPTAAAMQQFNRHAGTSLKIDMASRKAAIKAVEQTGYARS